MPLWRYMVRNGKTIKISIKEFVHTAHGNSIRRLITVLDRGRLEAVVRKTEAALRNPNILPASRASEISAAEITSLDHTSDLDPKLHSSVDLLSAEGLIVGKLHVATDPAQQQAARMI